MGEDTKPAIAEAIGTFILVFIGAGAGALGGPLPVVALAHGLALIMIVYTIGGVSGAQVNPAITLGITMAGKQSWQRAVYFWVAQHAGALVAALLLRAILTATVPGLGETTLGKIRVSEHTTLLVSPTSGLLVEAVLTTLLALSVMVSGVLAKNGSHAAIAIGLTLAACILMGGPLTGASLNPARTLGPGIVAGNLPDVWVYIVGPAIGGCAGAFLGRWLHDDSE